MTYGNPSSDSVSQYKPVVTRIEVSKLSMPLTWHRAQLTKPEQS